MESFSQLIEQKAHASGGEVMRWMAALAKGELLVESGVLLSSLFSEVLKAVESASALSAWVLLLDEHAREFPHEPNGGELFMACVAKSPFPLGMWLEALGYFLDWVQARNGSTSLEEALAYLRQCEHLALQKMPKGSLYRFVVKMLDLYGLEEL